MKKINLMLRKCKTMSTHLLRTTSSSSSSINNRRSKSSIADEHQRGSADAVGGEQIQETVFVGSARKRYVIDSKYLSHPLVNALIGRSGSVDGENGDLVVNCEVVLFDHLLWMVENSDLSLSLDELADLYYLN